MRSTISWDGGDNANMTPPRCGSEIRDTAAKDGVVAKEDGDAKKTLSQRRRGQDGHRL